MSNTNWLVGAAQSPTEFDELKLRARTRVEIRRAVSADLPKVFKFAKGSLPTGIAGKEVIASILEQNRNSILLFYRNANVVGFWAMLMLTARGLEDLLLGELNTLVPGRECLAVTLERPAAIYNWAIVAPGLASEGVYQVSQFLRKPRYRNANLYSRPNTKSGVNFNLRLGARPIPANQNGLYRYVRIANKKLALSRVA